MKIAVVIARILLGLVFLVFGSNNFFHFMPNQPIPGDAGVLADVLFRHGWFTFHGVLEVVAGVLLLIGRYVPVALVLLGPILVNILMFHLTLAAGILPGLICTLLEVFLIYAYWPAFEGIFTSDGRRVS
ncbi:DoxX family membrane protein [Tunturiibacter lichenicola]|uniref:DoxX family membrane protein n=1 Tax=Tunturiibacter lichenicola TaxID=2051959 RepID=UPI003D9AD353